MGTVRGYYISRLQLKYCSTKLSFKPIGVESSGLAATSGSFVERLRSSLLSRLSLVRNRSSLIYGVSVGRRRLNDYVTDSNFGGICD